MSSLRTKLVLALLVTGLSGVIIVAVLAQRVITSEFDSFVLEQQLTDYIADLTAYYEVYGSWDNMRMAGGRLPIPQSPPEESSQNESGSPPSPFPIRFALADREGHIIIPDQRYSPSQTVPEADLQQASPIVIGEETVGYLLPNLNWPGRDTLAEAYLHSINQLLLVATAGAVAVALVLSFVFARSLSNPLREIAAAIQSISRGSLEQRVPVRSRDELGQVAAALNQMSADLARANHLRRQMTADIAHELRTPLSVIVGYLESLAEGLLKPNPERFKLLRDEAAHLQHLVEDLRTLSLADAGELHLNVQWAAPAELLNLAAAAFSHRAEQQKITLEVAAAPDTPLLYVDPDRVLQVLSNLVSNALRYTPERGEITLASWAGADRQVTLSVRDTGSGIPPEHLQHIFERFYRADSSRNQEQDESGLGLAIARSIVEAHGGRISAASLVGKGTTITMTFPARSQDEAPAPAQSAG